MSFAMKRLLFDWHIPDYGEPIRLDVPAYLAAVDRMKPETIYLMGKSAFGCTYYDDAMGFHNRALKQDIFAELVGPLRERGIEVVAYFNITLNDVVAKLHPEWHQIDAEGREVIKFTYHQLCMNSPYRDLLLSMMCDLAGKYPVDGFWFDLTYWHEEGCFCACCREAFRAETGRDLTPELAGDPAALAEFHRFRRDTRRRFIEDAVARLLKVRPGLRFGFNHAGDPAFAEPETDRAATWLSREFHPPVFSRGGANARYMRMSGKPFELMLPESLGSWGDWTVMTKTTMRTMAAISAAHGGAPVVGHVAYPGGDYAGRVAPGVVETIADAFEFMSARAPFCRGASSVPVGAYFFSVEDFRAAQVRGGLLQAPDVYLSFRGTTSLMGDNNLHFDVLSEETLGRLGEYEYLVLGETEYIPQATAEALRRYVEGGGALIAFGRSGLADRLGRAERRSALAELLGVEFAGESPYSVAYLDGLAAEIAVGLPEMPLLLKAARLHDVTAKRRSLRCRAAADAQVWGVFADPALEPDLDAFRHIYHMHCPPSVRTEWPAIVHRRVGKGRTLYVGGPLGYAYGYTASPWLRRLFANLLGALGLPRAVRIDGPAGVETAYMRQGARRFLHLIPAATECPNSVQAAEGTLIAGVRARVAAPGTRSVRLMPQGRELPFRTGPEGIEFEIPPFSEWTLVEIE
jgi:hypothetical protein